MATGLAAVSERVRAVVGEGPVYLSVDVDGFDPAYAPGTGTLEVGGLTPREGLALLRALGGLDIIGADVVEVPPQYDPTTNTAQLAAQLLFEEFGWSLPSTSVTIHSGHIGKPSARFKTARVLTSTPRAC
jgi:arginase family enzyme